MNLAMELDEQSILTGIFDGENPDARPLGIIVGSNDAENIKKRVLSLSNSQLMADGTSPATPSPGAISTKSNNKASNQKLESPLNSTVVMDSLSPQRGIPENYLIRRRHSQDETTSRSRILQPLAPIGNNNSGVRRSSRNLGSVSNLGNSGFPSRTNIRGEGNSVRSSKNSLIGASRSESSALLARSSSRSSNNFLGADRETSAFRVASAGRDHKKSKSDVIEEQERVLAAERKPHDYLREIDSALMDAERNLQSSSTPAKASALPAISAKSQGIVTMPVNKEPITSSSSNLGESTRRFASLTRLAPLTQAAVAKSDSQKAVRMFTILEMCTIHIWHIRNLDALWVSINRQSHITGNF
jgi:hypothetical protein